MRPSSRLGDKTGWLSIYPALRGFHFEGGNPLEEIVGHNCYWEVAVSPVNRL